MLTYTYDVLMKVSSETGLPYKGILPFGCVGLDPKWSGESERVFTIQTILISTIRGSYKLTNGLTINCDYPVDVVIEGVVDSSATNSSYLFCVPRVSYNNEQLATLEDSLPKAVGCVVLMNPLTRDTCYDPPSKNYATFVKGCLIATPVFIDNSIAHNMWML